MIKGIEITVVRKRGKDAGAVYGFHICVNLK